VTSDFFLATAKKHNVTNFDAVYGHIYSGQLLGALKKQTPCSYVDVYDEKEEQANEEHRAPSSCSTKPNLYGIAALEIFY
jgi:hypothetical protein